MAVRAIPSIDDLRQRAAVRALEARFGATATLGALREAAAALRAELRSGERSGGAADRDSLAEQLEARAAARLDDEFAPSLRRVINATGVIVHTNLGRAPLPDAALDRVRDVATGYTNLEYAVSEGRRGARDTHAETLLRRLTAADAAVVVNNNAAATLLILAALGRGREVVISRGELVEIGGGFRVPDVMAQSGATLREVGTTNKTRTADYAAALGDRTGLILRVHPSNFRITGFTERPPLAELVALAHRFGVPIVEDLGSGFLRRALVARGLTREASSHERPPRALAEEPAVEDSLETGVDVVCFSGDKLLGGPQAGIILGRADYLRTIRTHPLMRALRVDKMTYAALEATLGEYAAGRAPTSVPVARMMVTGADTIGARAVRLAEALADGGYRATLREGMSTIGGGSAPGSELPTRLLSLQLGGLTADQLEARLRACDPPVLARILDDRVVLDLRTVLPDEDATLERVLTQLTVGGR